MKNKLNLGTNQENGKSKASNGSVVMLHDLQNRIKHDNSYSILSQAAINASHRSSNNVSCAFTKIVLNNDLYLSFIFQLPMFVAP